MDVKVSYPKLVSFCMCPPGNMRSSISIIVRVFANSPGDLSSIQDRFIPKTSKNGT